MLPAGVSNQAEVDKDRAAFKCGHGLEDLWMSITVR